MSSPDRPPDKKPNTISKVLIKSKGFFKNMGTKKDTTESDAQPMEDVQFNDTRTRNGPNHGIEAKPWFRKGKAKNMKGHE
jgi:hypothetical protein